MSRSYLYYGNGECTIEGTNITGVQIECISKNLKIQKTTNNNFPLISNESRILIFPIGEGSLNELFIYSGTLRIKSVIAVNSDGEKVYCVIKKVMDYAELLNSNAEDLTVASEDLKSEYSSGEKTIKEEDKIIINLESSSEYYLKDGTPYRGLFHIHLESSKAMTGGTHSEKSQELFLSGKRGLISTIRKSPPRKRKIRK